MGAYASKTDSDVNFLLENRGPAEVLRYSANISSEPAAETRVLVTLSEPEISIDSDDRIRLFIDGSIEHADPASDVIGTIEIDFNDSGAHTETESITLESGTTETSFSYTIMVLAESLTSTATSIIIELDTTPTAVEVTGGAIHVVLFHDNNASYPPVSGP